MGLCTGTVSCSPNAFVNTAWLAPLCRSVKPRARASTRTFSGDQSAFGLALWPPVADAFAPQPNDAAFSITVNDVLRDYGAYDMFARDHEGSTGPTTPLAATLHLSSDPCVNPALGRDGITKQEPSRTLPTLHRVLALQQLFSRLAGNVLPEQTHSADHQ